MMAIGIVAHTARAAEAKRLGRSVKARVVSIDNGVLGCDDNHEAVHHHLSQLHTEWSVVLEDDAVVVPTFRAQLREALIHSPSPLVSLYLGRLRPPQYQQEIAAAIEKADAADADWIMASRLYHGVGYAIKTAQLPSLIDHPSGLPADERISEWAMRFGHTISYTWPSLVDHADLPTVIKRHRDGAPRPAGRVAWRTGIHNEWSSRTVCIGSG